jgi:hypothetical protein
MSHNQASEVIQNTTSDLRIASDNGLSLQRASILFIACVSFFVGASLLLASL